MAVSDGRDLRIVAARGGCDECMVAARGGCGLRLVTALDGCEERVVTVRGGCGVCRVAARSWLMVALWLLVLLPVAFAVSYNENCTILGKEARDWGVAPRTASVALAWRGASARAAAAVLRAVLLSAGHLQRDVTLCSLRDDNMCTLLKQNVTDFCLDSNGKPPDVVVVVAAAWRPTECALSRAGTLDVLGGGLAPAAPSLHVRLPRAPLAAAAAFRGLGLLTLRTDAEQWKNATVYTVEEERGNVTDALCASSLCHEQSLPRAQLVERVRAGDGSSFLFLDAALWADRSDVVQLSAEDAPLSLLAADVKRLLEHAPALHALLVGNFTLPGSLLLDVLADDVGPEDAACRLAPRLSNFSDWRNLAGSSFGRVAVAIICNDIDYKKIEYAATVAIKYVNKTIDVKRLATGLKLETRVVNCDQSSALTTEISKLNNEGYWCRIAGIAAPAGLAAEVVKEAKNQQQPLIAYTPTAPETEVRSATGGPALLARALHRMLLACGWMRLGIVTEDTPLARRVRDELLATPGLLTRVTSADQPENAVAALRDSDTRVFFVNCDAAAAVRVLAAATKQSAPSDRHVWIVRDYETADASTEALQPLSVSFQWRGGAREPPKPGHPVQAELAQQWGKATWPRHAAALVDALITIGKGLEQLIFSHPHVMDHPLMENKSRYFWEGLQNLTINGIVEDLKYNEKYEVAPTVYIERWNWRGPQRLEWRDNQCPVGELERHPDGRVTCAWRHGDDYEQNCADGAWISAAVALLALGLVALAVRRWLVRRDRRLEHATTARVLERRDAAFAELASHLVPADALALGEELGAGRYGRVRRCEVKRSGRRLDVVAAKTLRDGASPAEESQFLREARLLAALRHDHVVRFEGVSWEGGPPLLLMELALFGDLLRYLRTRRHLAGSGTGPEAAAVSAEALTRLAREAAEALEYLGARGLVHRDVRAANCLVDARRSLKLADFGLARETGATDGEYTCRGRALFPVLWMAPESLERGLATAASDVWSFGVLALELVTLGARPFGAAAPEMAVRAVLAGGRPPLPRDACAETRAMALACWRHEPSARPTAARLAAWLARRPAALRPALAPDLEEPECDSGIGEPEPGRTPRRHTLARDLPELTP